MNWFVYCNNNPLSRTDPTGLLNDHALAMMENQQYKYGFESSRAYQGNLRQEMVQDEVEHPEREHVGEKNYTESKKSTYRGKVQLFQFNLPNGISACHFWSLTHMAEMASGHYFSYARWCAIYERALIASAIDAE